MLPIPADPNTPGDGIGWLVAAGAALFGVGAEIMVHATDLYHWCLAVAALLGGLGSVISAVNGYLAGRHQRRQPTPPNPSNRWTPSHREPSRAA